jgi:hypothetical protein
MASAMFVLDRDLLTLSSVASHSSACASPDAGEVSEWLKELVSKTSVRLAVPGVRIPPSPFFLTLFMQLWEPQVLATWGFCHFGWLSHPERVIR